MNIDIRDVNAVQAIRPVDAALYLRAQGWTMQDTSAAQASLWSRDDDGEPFEALLPMDPEVRDYALRMGELLAVLAAAEKRSQSQVYRDLLTVTADVLRIRIAGPDLDDGSLPIEEHAQIAQNLSHDITLRRFAHEGVAACLGTGGAIGF